MKPLKGAQTRLNGGPEWASRRVQRLFDEPAASLCPAPCQRYPVRFGAEALGGEANGRILPGIAPIQILGAGGREAGEKVVGAFVDADYDPTAGFASTLCQMQGSSAEMVLKQRDRRMC